MNKPREHAHFISQFGPHDSTLEGYYFQILEYIREWTK